MRTFKILPRYDELDAALPIIETNCLNVIVDLKSFIRQFHNNRIKLCGNIAIDIECIISRILTMISFYRNYFYKKNMLTKFYMLYSMKKCTNITGLHANYKADMYKKEIESNKYNRDCVDKAMPLLIEIINMTPECIFVDTSDFDENCYIKHIVDNSDEISLVLSRYHNAIMPALNSRSIILETWTSGIECYLYSVEAIAESLILGDPEYGFQGSRCSKDTYETSWKQYLVENDLLKTNTIHNPIDYEKMQTLITKKASIAKSISRYKDNHDKAFNILSGNLLYYINKMLISKRLEDIHSKYVVNQFIELNESFRNYPLNINCLLRGYLR